MKTFTYTSIADLPSIVAQLKDGEEQLVDLSGGCSHLQEIAEESGVEWEACWTSCNKFLLNGREVETWYDENASIWSCWKAFCKGIGTCRAPSLEEAMNELLEKMNETH